MIADVIKSRVPNVDLPDPDPANPDKWHRFPCPFCGKERAAINYAVGMFRCFHERCRVSIGPERKPSDNLLTARFQFQIEQAVRNFATRFPRIIERHKADVWQFARQCVVEYDRAGKIDDWEADYSGDQNQIDRFMLRELDTDLIDWAKKYIRRVRGDVAGGDVAGDTARKARVDDPVQDEVIDRMTWNERWDRWSYLALRFREGRSVGEIARIKGVSRSTAKRKMAEEMADARETMHQSR